MREETELLDGLVDDELAGRQSIAIARLEEMPAALARLVVVRLAEDATGTYVPQAGDRVEEILALDRRGGRAELHVGGQAGAVIESRRPRDEEAPASRRARLRGVATPARVTVEPGVGEVLVTAEDLQRRVAELGAEISRDYAGRPLLLVGVLKGAVFFLSDLMRFIDIPVEVDFMAVASYGSATDSSGVVRILKDLDVAIEGRDVLIVEDIVDSGLTLQYLMRNLGSRNPRTLEVCALLTKPERRKVDLPTRYVGFEIPDRFVVGYGLDYDERHRNLPFVAVLDRQLAHRCRRQPVQSPEGTGPHGTLGHWRPQLQTAPGPSGSRYEPFLQERCVPDPHRRGAGVSRRQTGQPGLEHPPVAQLPDARLQRDPPGRSQVGRVQEQGQSARSPAQQQGKQRKVRNRLHRPGRARTDHAARKGRGVRSTSNRKRAARCSACSRTSSRS